MQKSRHILFSDIQFYRRLESYNAYKEPYIKYRYMEQWKRRYCTLNMAMRFGKCTVKLRYEHEMVRKKYVFLLQLTSQHSSICCLWQCVRMHLQCIHSLGGIACMPITILMWLLDSVYLYTHTHHPSFQAFVLSVRFVYSGGRAHDYRACILIIWLHVHTLKFTTLIRKIALVSPNSMGNSVPLQRLKNNADVSVAMPCVIYKLK